MKIIMGIYSCDEGDILIDEAAVKLGKPAASLAHGILSGAAGSRCFSRT